MIYNYVLLLALFHDKKCCNCINLFPCIFVGFYCIGFSIKSREKYMTGSWRVVPDCQFQECLVGKAFPWDTHETFYLEDFLVWLSCPSPILYIPLLPTEIVRRPFREKNPKYVFYNTHTHLLERVLLIVSEKSF